MKEEVDDKRHPLGGRGLSLDEDSDTIASMLASLLLEKEREEHCRERERERKPKL